MNRLFTADFETTTKPDENGNVRVWAWAMCEIGDTDNFEYGTSIDSMFEYIKSIEGNHKLFWHNIKFDGSYIISWLYKNGFEYVNSPKEKRSNTFTTLISSMGHWYSIEIFFKVEGKKCHRVKMLDSLKIFNFSVADVAKNFNLPISKLEIDYDEYRPLDHKLTKQEVDYIRNDVTIMAMALDIMFNQGHTKMTISSDALAHYKLLNPRFRQYFPELPMNIDAEIRDSYKGGFTYLNPKYKEKETGGGIVFDVNSMYPAQLRYQEMPYGFPEPFEGQYKYDPSYPLYVQNISCCFELKKNKIPSIQIKNSPFMFKGNEYLESSDDEIVTLTLTKPDLELFFEQYEVTDIEYEGGWKFKSTVGLFNEYIDYWMQEKIKAGKEGNKAQRTIAKLFLNSLYGRFGLNPNGGKKIPVLGSDEELHYQFVDEEPRKPVYIPIATFTTAYARKFIIESSQAIRDWSMQHKGFDAYVYSDTDSIHAILTDEDVEELKSILQIDDYELGYWKPESKFIRGKYLRQKCYIEQDEEEVIHATIAGLPKKLAPIINFDNFKIGFSTADIPDDILDQYGRKLTYKQCDGGVILQPVDFTIK